MQREYVSSSNLRSVGYDMSIGILEVQFQDSSVYQYINVPSFLYEGLMKASSHGSYFDRFIKKGGFRYHRVR